MWSTKNAYGIKHTFFTIYRTGLPESERSVAIARQVSSLGDHQQYDGRPVLVMSEGKSGKWNKDCWELTGEGAQCRVQIYYRQEEGGTPSGTSPNKMSTGKNVEESLGKAGSKESRSNMSTVQASREIKDCTGLLGPVQTWCPWQDTVPWH